MNTYNVKSNSELVNTIIYNNNADLKNAAWKVLVEKNPTNSELTYIMRYCPDADLKNAAGKVLVEKNPTNSELTYIMEYCPDADLKNAAGKVLVDNLGVTGKIDEESLIKEIAETVLSRPGSLKMDSWHCGTSHCLAGWACVINKDAMNLENEHSTEIAGAAALPNYAYLFFSDNDVVLNVLREIQAK